MAADDSGEAAAAGAEWDGEVVRGLLQRLFDQHARGDNWACHQTALALGERMQLVRLILPQHPLWSVNVYRRCDFRCVYCSVWAQGAARPVHEGDALRKRLRLELAIVPPGHHTVLSSQSDAYVPIEERLGLARIAIEELMAAGRCVHVVTKGTTVLRDADLLRRAPCGKVEISLSTLQDDVATEIEPGATAPTARLALVDALAAAGVNVGISLAPWIPGLTDVAAVRAAVGPQRRITVSPLKCNCHGARLRLAGRTYTQQFVNRRYREERQRFVTDPLIKWEVPWQASDHYLPHYRPYRLARPGDSPLAHDPVPSPPQRLLRLLGASGFWRRAGRIHAGLYRATAGRVGHCPFGIPSVLLTTTGRRSGRARTTPVAYIEGSTGWIVAAANGGGDRHPAWWLNLRANPRATVVLGRTSVRVVAREAKHAERWRLWAKLKAAHRLARHYERMTARHIPVVVLEPLTEQDTTGTQPGAAHGERGRVSGSFPLG